VGVVGKGKWGGGVFALTGPTGQRKFSKLNSRGKKGKTGVKVKVFQGGGCDILEGNTPNRAKLEDQGLQYPSGCK